MINAFKIALITFVLVSCQTLKFTQPLYHEHINSAVSDLAEQYLHSISRYVIDQKFPSNQSVLLYVDSQSALSLNERQSCIINNLLVAFTAEVNKKRLLWRAEGKLDQRIGPAVSSEQAIQRYIKRDEYLLKLDTNSAITKRQFTPRNHPFISIHTSKLCKLYTIHFSL